MLLLIFLALAHLTFAQNYSCTSAASTPTAGEGPLGLAFAPPWLSSAYGGQDQAADCYPTGTSFTGPRSYCPSTCRDGQAGPLEMQILYAPGQGQIGTMWRLLEILVTMQRFELCASAAKAIPTSTWRCIYSRLARMARPAMARCRSVGFWKSQVPTETRSKPKATCAKAVAPKFQGRCEQRKRQGFQQGLCWSSFHPMAYTALIASFYGAFNDGGFLSECPNSINALNAAFPQACDQQGRAGTAFAAAHVQGNQKQVQFAGGHQEGGPCDRSDSPKGRRQDPQSVGVAVEQHAKEALRDRRTMGILSPTVGRLSRQSHSNVDVTCGGVRARRGPVCRKAWVEKRFAISKPQEKLFTTLIRGRWDKMSLHRTT